MVDAPQRFTLNVEQNSSLRIEIGHSFDIGDIAALVAAENALRAAMPRQRCGADTPITAVS